VNGIERGDKQHAAEIIKNQLVEGKRARLASRAEEARMNLEKGAVKTGTVEDMMEDLNRLSERIPRSLLQGLQFCHSGRSKQQQRWGYEGVMQRLHERALKTFKVRLV
jgi:hypothetical protein